MNLPISWLAAAAVPSAQIVQKATQSAASSASHFFGDLLQSSPKVAANGRSEAAASNQTANNSKPASAKSGSLSDRLTALRDHLASVVKRFRSSSAAPGDGEAIKTEIIADGVGTPSVNASDDLRVSLENYLAANPSLVAEINAVARESISSDPLSMLPAGKSSPRSLRLPLE